jgi:hypothetical protein
MRMSNMRMIEKAGVLLVHAFVGWALCAIVMLVGQRLFPLNTALIIHLIAAPVFFWAISSFYHSKFRFTPPIATAFIFTGFVMAVDFFLVALVFMKSLEMFESAIGTWIPFGLIFLSTWSAGAVAKRRLAERGRSA